MSIEKSLTAPGRLHLRRYLDNTQNIDSMADKLRPTPSGPFVDSVLETLDTANSALRPTPIPTDDATILNRCAEPIDYLRHHATPDYLQTGAPPLPTEEIFERIEGQRLGRISSEEAVAALEAERARR